MALGLGDGACISSPPSGLHRAFEGRGLVAVLSEVDAATHDGPAPVAEDAGVVEADAQAEHGCADGSLCPTGTALLMATYSTPCTDRTIICRRSPARTRAKLRRPADGGDLLADAIWLSGGVTRADVDAIVSAVARVDTQPLRSIEQRDDDAVATTGCAVDCLMGGGTEYRLRKVDDVWSIVKRTPIME